MKLSMTCAVAAVALSGCLGMGKLPTSKVNFKVPVASAGDRLTAYKVIGSVGDDQASNAGVRVRSPSLDELRTWQRVIELASYTPSQACFVWTDYQNTGNTYGDGAMVGPQMYADYRSATVALDTASGAHYDATAKLAKTPLTFQFDSYVTDSGYPHWVPAVAHWDKILYEACFDTKAPLAGETSARYTIKGSNWEAEFDFEFGAKGGGSVAADTKPVRKPAPAPASPPRPETFVGRWTGLVAMSMVAGLDTDGGSVNMTISIDELPHDTIELNFEGGTIACGIKAKVSGRRAAISTGQVCSTTRGKSIFKFKTKGTELALTETGLTISLELETTKRTAGKTERGKITLTGELAAL